MVLFPPFYHPVGEGIPAAYRAVATIVDVLNMIERDAPAALTDWIENKSNRAWETRAQCHEMGS